MPIQPENAEAPIPVIPSPKIRVLILKIGKFLMPKTKFGPVEFFLNAMSIDMVAPEYGKHKIEEYFEELKNQ